MLFAVIKGDKLFAEIFFYFCHSCHLVNAERAHAAAVAAANAVGGVQGKMVIVVGRHGVTVFGKVVILIYNADVKADGTGLAVVAVYAFALCVGRAEGADNAVVALSLG